MTWRVVWDGCDIGSEYEFRYEAPARGYAALCRAAGKTGVDVVCVETETRRAMNACETCWGDAYARARMLGGTQVEHYRILLAERAADHADPEETPMTAALAESTDAKAADEPSTGGNGLQGGSEGEGEL